MTPAAAPGASELFARAVELVRTVPLEPADRPPAFTLTRPPAVAAGAAPGAPAAGLAGDLSDTARALRAGETTVADVAAAAGARIAAFDARYHAFEALADTSAVVEELDGAARRGEWRGPLHGIPISVKDIIDVAGLPTTGSSVAVAARMATADAVAVARLRAAGAVIVGKAVTHEFALGVTTPQSFNPWDETRVPGGSSGGSAISLLTGMALGSLGTDTRASIRVPAALTGLVGFKPSLGVVPADSWITLSWTMDHFAPMARSVRDIALLMDVLTAQGSHYRSLLPGTVAGVRLATSPALLAGAEPGVAAAFTAAIGTIADAGATLVEGATPSQADLDLGNAAGLIVSRAEAAQFHGELGTDIERCIPEVRDQLRAASHLSATSYVRAMRLRGQLRDSLLHGFEQADFLVMPTSKVVAPRRELAGDYLLVLSENCIPWSFVDFPAISLFAGVSGGLPVGIQVVGPPGSDGALLRVAHAIEQALPAAPAWRPA